MRWLGAGAGFGLVLCLSLSGQTSVNVLTQHNDLARTGQNLSETRLTPASVSSGDFGKLFSLTVDGLVLAQPLYVSHLSVGGATHNVVFIATEHDSVFAFDADAGGAPLWQASLLDAAHGAGSGATTDPYTDTGCYVANGEYGITGTPVIDSSTNTLYVVSLTYENNYPVERLHALDITSGAEKFGGPATIAASLPGTGTGSSNGILTFDPKWEDQRAGLLLVNGTVYVAFAAHCDFGSFHGWLMAYSAATLAQTAVFVTTPNGTDGGIWMGASAPSVDIAGGVARIFLTTGNGSYDATAPYATNSVDYADDILRFDLSNGLKVADAFTPLNQATLSATDADLGSSGALLLPDQPGAHPHLLVEASKAGSIYLVDRDNLGGYSSASNNVVQEIDGQAQSAYGSAAYWNGNVYLWPAAGQLKQFQLSNGLLSASPVAISPQTQAAGLGSTPSISANGTTNGIVWSIDSSLTTQVLYAHDATNVANTLWSSSGNPTRDSAGPATKFGVPTVANGKVYVGSNAEVLVYGLSDFSLSATSTSLAVTQGQTVTDTIDIALQPQFTGAISLSAANLPSGVTVAFTSTAGGYLATFTAASSATPGSYSVTVTGSSGSLSHSLNVTLNVSGFTVTPASTSLTLSAGTSGMAQLAVNVQGIVVTNLSLACSVAATLANVTCSVPGTVTDPSNVPVTITAAANAVTPRWEPPVGPRGLFYVLLGLVSASLAFAFTRQNKNRALASAFALILVLSLASCGGGGMSSSMSSNSSSAESGVVTVMVTSGTLSHSAAISVTIQ